MRVSFVLRSAEESSETSMHLQKPKIGMSYRLCDFQDMGIKEVGMLLRLLSWRCRIKTRNVW